jgi:hypothetical protein
LYTRSLRGRVGLAGRRRDAHGDGGKHLTDAGAHPSAGAGPLGRADPGARSTSAVASSGAVAAGTPFAHEVRLTASFPEWGPGPAQPFRDLP